MAKTRTKVVLEFIVEHDAYTHGNMLGVFNVLDFIEAGLRAHGMPRVTEIEPGAKLKLSLLGSHRAYAHRTKEER